MAYDAQIEPDPNPDEIRWEECRRNVFEQEWDVIESDGVVMVSTPTRAERQRRHGANEFPFHCFSVFRLEETPFMSLQTCRDVAQQIVGSHNALVALQRPVATA